LSSRPSRGTPDRSVGLTAILRAGLLRCIEADVHDLEPLVCRFVEATGERAAIGRPEDLPGLVDGTAGTQVLV
jgi:hypothetical protein